MEVSAETFSSHLLSAENSVCVLHPADFKPTGLCSLQQRRTLEDIGKAITALGEASAKAQQLKAAVTSYKRFIESDHCLYLLKEVAESPTLGTLHTSPPHMIIGLLKVGKKKLFLNDGNGNMKTCSPLCLLDFYVSEAFQRMGYGQALFSYMLKRERVSPEDLAVDRPSRRMIHFLAESYGLREMQIQPNNFVFFHSASTSDSAVDLNSMGCPVSFSPSCVPSQSPSILTPLPFGRCVTDGHGENRKGTAFHKVGREVLADSSTSQTSSPSLNVNCTAREGLSASVSDRSIVPIPGSGSIGCVHGRVSGCSCRRQDEMSECRLASSKFAYARESGTGILPHLPPIRMDHVRFTRRK